MSFRMPLPWLSVFLITAAFASAAQARQAPDLGPPQRVQPDLDATRAELEVRTQARQRLGPRPSADDPAALAAWRAAEYDLRIAAVRSNMVTVRQAFDSGRLALLELSPTADAARRESALLRVEDWLNRQKSLDLQLYLLESARKAIGEAERARLAGQQGDPRTLDDELATIDRGVQTLMQMEASQGRVRPNTMQDSQARMSELNTRSVETARSQIASLTAMAASRPDDPQVAAMVRSAEARLEYVLRQQTLNAEYDAAAAAAAAAQEKARQASDLARLEGVGYAVVRMEVEAGRWSSDALAASAERLRTAQEAMYSAREEVTAASSVRNEVSTRRMDHSRVEMTRLQQEREEQMATMEAQLAQRRADRGADDPTVMTLQRQLEQLRQMVPPSLPPLAPPPPPTQVRRPPLPTLPVPSIFDAFL